MKSKVKIHFLIDMIVTFNIIASAQTRPANPYGQVYGDAFTKNVPCKVNIHPVTYKLNGIYIAKAITTTTGHMPIPIPLSGAP
ncbi:MAG: hypothetical protein FD181_2613 [Prolixibacteraceae bacterium]|nr:MAG: hypothetical protein FD181_2613 [Prolixibacteraceae bacterium]